MIESIERYWPQMHWVHWFLIVLGVLATGLQSLSISVWVFWLDAILTALLVAALVVGYRRAADRWVDPIEILQLDLHWTQWLAVLLLTVPPWATTNYSGGWELIGSFSGAFLIVWGVPLAGRALLRRVKRSGSGGESNATERRHAR